MREILEKLQQYEIDKIKPKEGVDTGVESFQLQRFQNTLSTLNLDIIKKSQPKIDVMSLYSKRYQPDKVYLEILKPDIIILATFYNIFYNLKYELNHFRKIFRDPPEFLKAWSKNPSVELIIQNIVLPILQNNELSRFADTIEKILLVHFQLNIKIIYKSIITANDELNILLSSKHNKDGLSPLDKTAIRELRDKTFKTIGKHKDFISNIEFSLHKHANSNFLAMEKHVLQLVHEQSLPYFQFCVGLLENDTQFQDVLVLTDKHIIYLERAIVSPYYNFNNTGKIEPHDEYHKRLINYKHDLENYKNMVSIGDKDQQTDLSAFNNAKNFGKFHDEHKSDINYNSLLNRFKKFEAKQAEYLAKIERLQNAIDDRLDCNKITLTETLNILASDASAKKILVTVINYSNESKYQILGHNTSGHMLAILFDDDKPPVCISRYPIANGSTINNNKMNVIKRFVLKLLGLPHNTYPAINREFQQEIKNYHIHEKSKLTNMLPPIVFHCNDDLGIDFSEALAQTTNDTQGVMTHDFENNCADQVRKIIEAGISKTNLELGSSTLAGMTVPMTLYKSCQKLHDNIQQKRDMVAKKSFAVEQKQLESVFPPTKIAELKVNFENAKNALRTIANSIKDSEIKCDPQCTVFITVQQALRRLDKHLPSSSDNHFWTTFDSAKLYTRIQNEIQIEKNKCKNLLVDINEFKYNHLISQDKFQNLSINDLLRLFMSYNIKVPLYADAALITFEELLKTLPVPYTIHLEQICEQIIKELPAQPTLDLDMPVQINSRFVEALKPVYRNDGQPNLLHNTMQLRNIILDIQYKQAKFIETKLRLDPNHESAGPLLKQLEQAISYCQNSAELLQIAYGKLNQALYFESLDVVARKDQPNPFYALKKIFPSINHYYHLQDIFEETSNIFPNTNLPKPRFWQIWKKYEYKIQRTKQYIKNTFNNDQCSSRNYTAMKKKISKLKPNLWDQFWLSDKTLKQRRKHYNELSDKVHLLFLLKSFAQGALSGSELILQLKSLADKSVSIHKDNIAQLYQNLSETQQFYLQQSDREKIDNYEQTALKTLTSTTAILLRCNYPDRSKLTSKGVNATNINEIIKLDEKINHSPSLFNPHNVNPGEDPTGTTQLPDSLEEKLLSINSAYMIR